MLLTTAAVAADNLMPYMQDLQTRNQEGPMVEDVDGCPHIPDAYEMHALSLQPALLQPDVDQLEAAETLAIEEQYAPTRSSAENFKPEQFNILDAAVQWENILDHEISGFTSTYSGIDFHIYSDEADPFETLDLQGLDELFHAAFSDKVHYEHIGVRTLMDCMRHRFIDADGPRELEGTDVNVYIASGTGVCWSNGLVQEKPSGVLSDTFCDSAGATYMGIELSLGPLKYQEGWTAIMTTDTNPATYPTTIAQKAIHEVGGHLWAQAAGIPFKIRPNEALAQYIENQVIGDVYGGTVPTPITYK